MNESCEYYLFNLFSHSIFLLKQKRTPNKPSLISWFPLPPKQKPNTESLTSTTAAPFIAPHSTLPSLSLWISVLRERGREWRRERIGFFFELCEDEAFAWNKKQQESRERILLQIFQMDSLAFNFLVFLLLFPHHSQQAQFLLHFKNHRLPQ